MGDFAICEGDVHVATVTLRDGLFHLWSRGLALGRFRTRAHLERALALWLDVGKD